MAPGLTWGFPYLRSVAFEAMRLRRRYIKGLAGATRRSARPAGLKGSAPPRYLHPRGQGSAEMSSLLVSTLSQP